MRRKIFEYVDNTYQPRWLPQMEADYGHILKELDNAGVKYAFVSKKPEDLKPLQDTVNSQTVDYFSKKIDTGEEILPAFISKDDEILDGHNRTFAFKNNPKINSVYCIKIALPCFDAANVLSRIQDRVNWEKELDTDTVEGPIGALPTDNVSVQEPITEDSKKTSLDLYRMQPIKKNSKTGNFFVFEKKDRFNHQYSIDFDNIYEFPDDKVKDNDPISSLAEAWFGDLNVMRENAVKQVLSFDEHVIRKICDEAKKRGFDGIKYGTKFMQTI